MKGITIKYAIKRVRSLGKAEKAVLDAVIRWHVGQPTTKHINQLIESIEALIKARKKLKCAR